MRKTSKIITALALAGMAVAGGAAFTATGVAEGTQAASDQFLGGSVDQSVTGAVLESIVYTHDLSGTTVNGITLTFNAAVAENAHVSAIATIDGSPDTTAAVAFTTVAGPGGNHNLVYTATAPSLVGLNKLVVTVADADALTSTTFQNPASWAE